jgi:two-component system LytT family sensor kinase
MKELSQLNKKQIRIHVLIWLFVLIYLFITNTIDGSWAAKIVGIGCIFINFMFVHYVLSLFVFPKFWGRNIFVILALVTLSLFLYWSYYYSICIIIIPLLGGSTYYQTATTFYFLKGSFYFFFLSGLAGIASFFNRYSLYNLKIQVETEKALLVKELNFLKAHFNPEITYSFLDYSYNNVKQFDPETAKAIVLFSDMLRYTLQSKPKEIVAVTEEIEYIKQFVKLQQLLSAKVFVTLNQNSIIEERYIVPRILITFVENAFKHGLYNNPEHPISIDITLNENQLQLIVKNLINPGKRIASTHTGLANVKQILELYYMGKYQLITSETNGVYLSHLNLTLQL